MMRIASLLAILLVAGCAAPTAADVNGDDARAIPAIATVPWSYLCERAGYAEVAQDVCVTGFADPAAAITEPSIAVYPGSRDILAVGVNRHDSANVLVEFPDRGRPQLVETEVWFSADGGSTWKRTRPPDMPGAGSVSEVDASLAFGPDGTLHFSSLLEGGTGEPYVYYTSTRDMGATWTRPEALAHAATRGTIDRNWLSVGPDGAVYVTWQTYPVGGGAAFSRDGGTTWTKTDVDGMPCVRQSPAAVVDGEPLVACRPTGVVEVEQVELVYVLNVENGTWEERGRIDEVECDGALLTAAASLAVMTCGSELYTSKDGGRTWTGFDLLELATVEDGWPATRPYALAGDARGLVHILLGSRDGGETLVMERNPVVDERVAHLIIDPATGALHHEMRVTASDPAALRRVPPVLVPAVADDYFGIAVTPTGVYLAWTRDRGIDVAYASPEPRH